MNLISKGLLVAIAITSVCGCSTTQYGHSGSTDQSNLDAKRHAERQVILGMGSANITAVLGSPSIVTNLEGDETSWTYDRISSDVSYAHSGDAVVGVIFDRSFDNSIARKTGPALQPTLTVVIRFNQYDRVKDFSYYTSR